MEDLHVISTSIVQPESENQWIRKIELTPWDLSLLPVDYTQRGLLFSKPTSSQEEELNYSFLINNLKTSLCHTLNIFSPFAGRLATTQNVDKTNSFYIDCNSSGVEFVHAVADGTKVADILESVYVPDILHSFFPMNGVRSFEGISKPLLAVQVTEINDGIFIGCSYNHMVTDGTSFWHFVNTWSEISKTSNHTSQLPILKSWFLDGFDHPIRVPFSHHELVSANFSPPQLQERVLHFTKEKIAELKAKANAEIGTDKISRLQALLGLFWRSIIRNRNLDPDQAINFRVLVNMRQRLNPSLPQNYFRNITKFGTATTTAGELLQHGLGWAAWQINKMVALQTDEEARNNLESWVENPTLKKLGGLSSNAVIVGSSPRFNVYGNDFGWGRPIAVRGGSGNNVDGKLTVFSGAEEEGSVDIQVCLFPETLQAMSKDAEFMEAVTI